MAGHHLSAICFSKGFIYHIIFKYPHIGIGVPKYTLYFCKMMKIDQFSKLSEIIDANASAIEAIAKINSNFNKLKNPVLRKMLTPRVNIKQAAAIGGVDSDVLLKELEKIGFIISEKKIK